MMTTTTARYAPKPRKPSKPVIDTPDAVDRLILHARRYGTEDVLGVALRRMLGRAVSRPVANADDDVITPRDIGRLVAELRRIEPRWRLPRIVARWLAVELVMDGVPLSGVANITGLSVSTVRKLRRENRTTPRVELHADSGESGRVA